MNPVHRMHLTIFDVAAKFLSKYHGIDILVGYLSASCDRYVRGKLRAEAIPFVDRHQMCKLATAEHNSLPGVLHIEADEWEGSQSVFVDFGSVRDRFAGVISTAFPDVNLPVYYLCGIDHFERCGLAAWDNCVAVARPPYVSRSSQDSNLLAHKGIYICATATDEEIATLFADVSSTEIRRRREQHLGIADLTYPSVEQYLKQSGWI
jgi:nicotinic acid mononucleotide adenylyltransferase